jgi:hypothetical protein
MPPPTQRRNSAYLNPLIERPAALTGLAIDLGARPNFASDPLTSTEDSSDTSTPGRRGNEAMELATNLRASETICAF